MAQGGYDHQAHAGNAGDVWKHFLLAEAAQCLLDSRRELFYAESHAGRPHYFLESPGEWEGAIGRIWHLLPALLAFPYFRILSKLNPSALENPRSLLYPGSARLVYELAMIRGADLRAHIWDNHPVVAASWQAFLSQDEARADRLSSFSFHQSDGFSGVLSLLRRTSPDPSAAGLLFIDPPYLDPQDVHLAERLLHEAEGKGWTVLWWYMTDKMTAPESMETLELDFAQAGLDGGRWKGSGIAVAGPKGWRLDHLLRRLRQGNEEFIRILKSD